MLRQESLFIPLKNGLDTLHLRRIWKNPEGIPVFMVHGAMANGRTFYSESGKGLAPWLAERGYDVFVADFRGKGLSTPPINKDSDFGLKEMQEEDMPAFLEKIKEVKGDRPQHWISHSWGGVTLLAYLAKSLPSTNVASLVFFASKRRISVQNPRKWWMINFGWGVIGRITVAFRGYMDAPSLNFGSDNESRGSNREIYQWAKQKPWIDWRDGFDYRAALQSMKLPPVLSMTGLADHVLGHRADCQLLLEECGPQIQEYRLLSKAKGNQHDYGHVDILTSPDAPSDQFLIALEWMQKHETQTEKIGHTTT